MALKHSLPIKIAPSVSSGKISIEIDADRFEQLASALGLFSADFMASVEASERQIRKGHTKVLRSLRDLS